MIILGDARHVPLQNNTVQCCVCSPPYWGLRDYKLDGRGIGLEKTPEEYVANIVQAFREVKRVLRPDATLWLNLGDCYSGAGRGDNPNGKQGTNAGTGFKNPQPGFVPHGLKPKDLVGIPWRVAFALQADGWYLRSDIIWAKPNPMPESVTDRPTKAHEYVFLLTKSAHYFYDAEAVKESSITGDMRRPYAPGQVDSRGNGHDRGGGQLRKQDALGKNTYTGFNDRYNHDQSAGRNRRDVWTIPTQPYKGVHFATYPEKLVEPCILAGTSPKCCGVCGAPWERVVKCGRMLDHRTYRDGKTMDGPYASQAAIRSGILPTSETLGWRPTCDHNDDTGKCLVLDPFCGSGTTGAVAKRLGRDFVGLELNPDYIKLAEKRIGAVTMRMAL